MQRFSVAIFFVFSFLFSSISHSQTSSPVWFTLNAPEGSVITATASITLRYGQLASTCAVTLNYGPCNGVPVGTPTPEIWTSPQTFSSSNSSTVSVTVSNDTFGIDPLPGVYKTVQIQEQATAQTITVDGQSVTVPALSDSSSSCQLVANPSTVSFRNTTVGYTLSSSASLTSNCSAAITVSAVQISSPYSVSGIQTPFSLSPNQTQNYTVVFAPTAAGAANGSINFLSNAGSSASVTLNGIGVASSQAVNHSASLSWNGSGSQVAGYKVYRSTVSGGPYSAINSALATSTSYTDQTVVSGTTYYYTVTAVGTNGGESGYSNEATVVVPSP